MDSAAILALIETPPGFFEQFVEVFRCNNEEDVAEAERNGTVVQQVEISSDSAASASPGDEAGPSQLGAKQTNAGTFRSPKTPPSTELVDLDSVHRGDWPRDIPSPTTPLTLLGTKDAGL